ncbi:MAG TPA: hypothetical protein VD928_02090 [Candidatus Paceibacterota bacterium]|nr:hypothetical protein [Candidatus Paceibacterota bacterium]
MFLRSWLYRHAPYPRTLFDKLGFSSPTVSYMDWWDKSRLLLIAWHRRELKEIDADFAFQSASLELMSARDEARRKGVGPGHPDYPVLGDIWKPKSH